MDKTVAVIIVGFIDYPVVIFYLARLAGFLFFLILFWIGWYIIPKKYRYFLAVYGLIPMVMHQATEVSYDVMLLSLSPLLFALVIRILNCEKSKFWEYVLLFPLTIVTILVKPGYYALALCPILVFWMRYRKIILKKNWLMIGMGLVAVLIVNIMVWVLVNKVKDTGYRLISPSYQIEILKYDPPYGIRILSDTWEAKSEFYVQSFLGYFGWLDYKYDLLGFLIVFGMLVYVASLSFGEVKGNLLDWFLIVVLFLMIVGSYVLISFIFWLYWTNVGASVVEGVQGRYLLPFVPFVLWLLLEVRNKLGDEKIKMLVLLVLVTIVGINTVKLINNRYYDFSTNFNNNTELSKSIEDSRKEELPLEKVSSKDKMERFFETSESDVVGGFQFAMEKNDALVRVPYSYKITDEEGKKIYRKGYLTQDKLQKNGVYEQVFKPFKSKGKPINVVITPVINDNKENYFDYLSLYNEIQAKLLFVTKEQK